MILRHRSIGQIHHRLLDIEILPNEAEAGDEWCFRIRQHIATSFISCVFTDGFMYSREHELNSILLGTNKRLFSECIKFIDY